jgi:hypothetical protein
MNRFKQVKNTAIYQQSKMIALSSLLHCHLDQRERSCTRAIKISPAGRDDNPG